MKSFISNNLLIKNAAGQELYEKYAKDKPIYDYHCHLSPQDIAENKVFYNICDILLDSDHYKWRLMREVGISEDLITGNTDKRLKFMAFAKALSRAIGNPLYVWTHMELKRYFDISEPLNEKSAMRIYDKANSKMADGSYSTQYLISCSNVYLIATTDDPADDLIWHKKIREQKNFITHVIPTFRPDFACNITKEGFCDYIKRLGSSENTTICSLDNLLEVLNKRLDYFESLNCRIADHGITNIPDYQATYEEASVIFEKALKSEQISNIEAEKYLYYMLSYLAQQYSKRGLAMQIHTSVIRNQNDRIYKSLGPDIGIDSVGDEISAISLGKLFREIENTSGMPKTILYTLNPNSYYVLSTMAGNFAGDIAGKMQLGAAWWFNDHQDGILQQLRVAANTSVFGEFIGMLTDSRSFISFVRHDYFRRILCSLIGEWIENGEVPFDQESLNILVSGICFYNAKNYFGI